MYCRLRARASIPTRGAWTARSSSCVARPRSEARTTTDIEKGSYSFQYLLLREFLRELHPFALGRQLLIRTPVRPRVARLPQLFARDCQIEVRVRVRGVEPDGLAVARLRLAEAAEVVIDVSKVEVGLEEVGFEADGAFVERLRFDQLVAAVVNVGEVDQGRNQVRIELQGLAVRGRGL